MKDLSLHILDIAENSIDAGAGRVEKNYYKGVQWQILHRFSSG